MTKLESTLERSFIQLFRFIRRKECGIVYLPEKRWFGLRVRGSSGPLQQIKFCPFTGKKLPPDLWNRYFKELEKKGIDWQVSNPSIPKSYRTEQWWLDGKL